MAIFENRDTPNPFPPPPDGPPLPPIIPMQAVPTGVVKGPDGALYMSQLTGFPFPVGGANVYRIDPRSGKTSVYATGFTNIIDLDFGKDGTLYVLEMDATRCSCGRSDRRRRRSSRSAGAASPKQAGRAPGRDADASRRGRGRQAR